MGDLKSKDRTLMATSSSMINSQWCGRTKHCIATYGLQSSRLFFKGVCNIQTLTFRGRIQWEKKKCHHSAQQTILSINVLKVYFIQWINFTELNSLSSRTRPDHTLTPAVFHSGNNLSCPNPILKQNLYFAKR